MKLILYINISHAINIYDNQKVTKLMETGKRKIDVLNAVFLL